jgi:hypothetical protein
MGELFDRIFLDYFGANRKPSLNMDNTQILGLRLIEEYLWRENMIRVRCGVCGMRLLEVSRHELMRERDPLRLRELVFDVLRRERIYHENPEHSMETVMLRKNLFGDSETFEEIRNPPSEAFLRKYGELVLKAHEQEIEIVRKPRERVRVIRLKGVRDGKNQDC